MQLVLADGRDSCGFESEQASAKLPQAVGQEERPKAPRVETREGLAWLG